MRGGSGDGRRDRRGGGGARGVGAREGERGRPPQLVFYESDYSRMVDDVISGAIDAGVIQSGAPPAPLLTRPARPGPSPARPGPSPARPGLARPSPARLIPSRPSRPAPFRPRGPAVTAQPGLS